MKLTIATACEGLNRTTRVWRLIEHLQAQGHIISVVGSGRAFGALTDVVERTFTISYKPSPYGQSQEETNWQNNKFLLERLKQFQPQAMILDGEPFAASLANQLQIPIISVDHQHLFQFARLDLAIPPKQLDRLVEIKEHLKSRNYRAHTYLMPLFFDAQVSAPNAQITQGLTRMHIDQLSPSQGDAFVAFGWPHIQSDLRACQLLEQKVEVHVPLRKHRKETERVVSDEEVHGSKGTLRRRRKEALPRKLESDELASMLPDDQPFITHQIAEPDSWLGALSQAKAVLMDGELTAINEAIALGVPMLLLPYPERFDQWCYAHMVEKMGFGEVHPKLTRNVLEGFLSRLPRYKEQLANATPNTPSFHDALDQVLRGLGGRR